MSRLTIDLGTAGNPATGDSIRTAFNKVNENFTELYAELGGDSLDTLSFTNNTISSGITNGTLVLQGNGTGAVDIEGIQVNDNQIITTTTNANLLLDGNGTGTVVINGLSFPIADGSAGQVLKTDGAGNLSFTAVDPGAITLVGDDSTGTAVNIGETFKIAGTQNITTAVSGDTLTITGPNLSTYFNSSQNLIYSSAGGYSFSINKNMPAGQFMFLQFPDPGAAYIAWNANTEAGHTLSLGMNTVPTGDRILLLPDKSGTLATTADTAVKFVGDDSTGTAVNIGETFKIAGTQNITTAVSGDTLTITGPNLSSYLTAVPKTIDVNEISSSDSSAIQINDAVNISGALTANVINIGNASEINFDGGTGNNFWKPTIVDGTGTINKAGVYKAANNSNNSLFTFGANGAGVMSVIMDGSLFVGSTLPSNNGGLNTDYGGWLVVQAGGKFGGDLDTLGRVYLNGNQFEDDSGVLDFFSVSAGNHIVTCHSDWTLKLKARANAANQGNLWLEAGQNTKIKVKGNGSTIDLLASDGTTSATWTFAKTGTITFPDSTTQSTAAKITVVGDDSTGVTLNAGETFKIAGTQNITTAVSGDTLTITGPDLSSYLTAVPKTIDVNEISSSDSSAIQINDAVNVSGAGTFHGSVRFNAGYTEKINALTSSSTITVNCATASIHTVTLAVSTGFVISNLPTGGTVTLIITQGGSGSYAATFGTDTSTTVKFPGGAPTLSTAVGEIDVVTIFNDGTNYLGNIAKAYAA